MILRELLLGSHRFSELENWLPRISRSLLIQRLRYLEAVGLVERRACRVWLIDGGEAWSAYRSPDLQWELEKLPGVISLV